jgi:hypothetical protein
MRRLILAAGFLALATAAPARAGTPEEIAAHGMIVTLQGMDYDLTFTPDGKFTGLDGQLTGTWRIDGDKLCTTPVGEPENCVAFPSGKKSGDTFEVTGPRGPATVKIK